MSQGMVRVVGFGVAAVALLALADVAPNAAIGLAICVGLGVVLTRTDQITPLLDSFAAATGHPHG